MIKLLLNTGISESEPGFIHDIVFVVLGSLLVLAIVCLFVACIRFLKKGDKNRDEKDD